jgi:hypothetical protein
MTTYPLSCGGICNVICVPVCVRGGRVVPSSVTRDPLKFAPLIVTIVPPAIGP